MPSIQWNEIYEVAEQSEAPPAAGQYLVEVETAKWGKSGKGKEQLKLRGRIVSGPEKGKALFTSITISPDSSFALKIAVRQLVALGLTREVVMRLTDVEQEELVVGTIVLMTTKIDSTYDPRNPRSSVEDIEPAPEGVARSATPSAGAPPARTFAPTPTTTAPPRAPFSEVE